MFPPHVLRRTWKNLCLRVKMRLLHLQYLGGWTSTEIIDHYAQMVDEDLVQEHKAHSPVITCENERFSPSQKSDNRDDQCCKIHDIGINFLFHNLYDTHIR